MKYFYDSPIAHPARQLVRAQGWRGSCRAIVLSSFLLASLSGCKGVGLSHLDTGGYATPAGLSSFDTESPESKENQKWFDGYYGGNHGWGWGSSGSEDTCGSFYGSCSKGGGGGITPMNDPTPDNDSSGW